MITDYSSVLFDYSIYRKPFVLFCPDIEAYEKSRGFYADIKSFPAPIAKNRNELEKVFRDKLYDNYSKEQLEDFFKEYMGSCDGHSAERILSELSIS